MDVLKLYRWCDKDGGGLVFTSSVDEAREKLMKKYSDRPASDYTIWPWKNDDYFDEDNVDVWDIYGL